MVIDDDLAGIVRVAPDGTLYVPVARELAGSPRDLEIENPVRWIPAAPPPPPPAPREWPCTGGPYAIGCYCVRCRRVRRDNLAAYRFRQAVGNGRRVADHPPPWPFPAPAPYRPHKPDRRRPGGWSTSRHWSPP